VFDSFTLTFALSTTDADSDELIERLGAAGCDDALVGLGRRGRLALEFTRQAPRAGDAVGSAIADVRRAVPAATLMEARDADSAQQQRLASLLG
jgi:hypothetical protein